MIKIPLILQTDGISCGNTCIKMILEHKNIHKNVSIQDIIDICGTNVEHGTRDIEMLKGLTHFNIPNKQNDYIDDEDLNIEYLDNLLSKGNIFLLRTLTHGVKHWVIVYGKKNGLYLINDPWLGLKSYRKKDIIDIWKPRNYDGFEIFINEF